MTTTGDGLRQIDDDHVRFTYQDHRADPAPSVKTMTLAATEFIRRFLLHVLPLGFHRIRYYGFLGPRHRTQKLTRCRQLLASTPSLATSGAPVNATASAPRLAVRARLSMRLCPTCGHGQLLVIDRLPPTRGLSIGTDTS